MDFPVEEAQRGSVLLPLTGERQHQWIKPAILCWTATLVLLLAPDT